MVSNHYIPLKIGNGDKKSTEDDSGLNVKAP